MLCDLHWETLPAKQKHTTVSSAHSMQTQPLPQTETEHLGTKALAPPCGWAAPAQDPRRSWRTGGEYWATCSFPLSFQTSTESCRLRYKFRRNACVTMKAETRSCHPVSVCIVALWKEEVLPLRLKNSREYFPDRAKCLGIPPSSSMMWAMWSAKERKKGMGMGGHREGGGKRGRKLKLVKTQK